MKALIHAVKYFTRLDAPVTQVSSDELACLRRYARDAQILVEVGTFEGATTRELAESTSGQVYSMDVFFSGRSGICYPEVIARHHCRKRSNVTILKGASVDVGRTFSQPVDFLFIDADHSYEGVKMDWSMWFPKVKVNGIIALHDCKYTARMPQPQGSWEFYEKEIRALTQVEEIDAVESLVVLRKRADGEQPLYQDTAI
jgi:predicted O-methyltransferase YrrM